MPQSIGMQKIFTFPSKKIILIIGIIVLSGKIGWSQATYVPYSYQFDQKFNADLYSSNSSAHTALKPYILDTAISLKYKQLMSVGVDSSRKNYFLRKIFNEHIFDVHDPEYTFFADYLPDLQIGREFQNKTTTFLNTRGYQLGGTVGNNFYFYSSGYEDQGKFPVYYKNYVNSILFIPGESYDRDASTDQTADWSYVTADVSYTPIKQLNITLAEDKTFIGDGYRSLLLSDFAANYPLLRITANLGPVQYMMMWTNMEDRFAKQYDTFQNNRRKWGVFHYVDWTVTKRFSLGFFDAIIAADANDEGVRHPFDANYLDPLVFSSSFGSKTPYPDNVYNGFTAKYKVLNKTAIYAQLLLDRIGESTAPQNTYGYQVGVRGADLFKVTNFNYLLEYNTVKPYTYQSPQVITNYSDYSQPLGDPLGANFKEVVGILDYTIGRFDFQGQLNYAQFGLNLNANDGQNVLDSFDPSTVVGSTTGQGLRTNLYYGEGTIAFIINPKYNLRFEIGGLYRRETNAQGTNNTKLITFGLRSTFRDLYHDF
jgi:hypothetical protein